MPDHDEMTDEQITSYLYTVDWSKTSNEQVSKDLGVPVARISAIQLYLCTYEDR